MLKVNREKGRGGKYVAVDGHNKIGQNDPLALAGAHCQYQLSLCPRTLHSCALLIPMPNITHLSSSYANFRI
jgi:hypothetical protein